MMHLSELVRTSFIAATASVDQLKLAGYEALRVCVFECVSMHPYNMCVHVHVYVSDMCMHILICTCVCVPVCVCVNNLD